MPRASTIVPLLLLAACATGYEVNEPLTPIMIGRDFYGHLMQATAADGTLTLYRFGRGSLAQRIGDDSEYIRWYADQSGLCLQEFAAAAPVCAPVYQLNVAHFRWGDTTFADLTIPEPGYGYDFDQKRFRGRGVPLMR